MIKSLSLQPVLLETGTADSEGLLIMADGKLVAVIVRLCEQHEGSQGMWNLEAGFGRLAGSVPLPFIDVDSAQDWIAEHMER